MRAVRYEINILRGLMLAARVEGRRLLFPPSEAALRSDLESLVLREQQGYREIELDVCRRHMEELEQQRQDILKRSPYERDPRTGQTTPVAPGLVAVDQELERLRKEGAEHERVLATLQDPETRRRVGALLDRFELHSAGEWEKWQNAGGDGILVQVVSYGYGLIQDPEEQLEARRAVYDLPPGSDWV